MLSQKEITEILRLQRPYLAAEYGVKRIGVFGSYARGTPHQQSDVDLIIEFEHPIGLKFMELATYLEDLLKVPVDILTPAGIRSIRNAKTAKNIRENAVYVQ